MATKKNDAENARNSSAENKSGDKKQNASAAFDKLTQEAEEDSPRSKKPGSSNGRNSEHNNNGRGGGK